MKTIPNLLALLLSLFFIIGLTISCDKENDDEPADNRITDGDGNVYNYIEIGGVKWLTENLKTTTYNDGTPISYPGTQNQTWQAIAEGAYAWYENDEDNKNIYGALYNWFVIDPQTNGNKNICPEGWRVPTDIEWLDMVENIGGFEVAAGNLKTKGTSKWDSPNTGATDKVGFGALPGGARQYNGNYDIKDRINGYWWAATDIGPDIAWGRSMSHDSAEIGRLTYHKKHGFSIRCIK